VEARTSTEEIWGHGQEPYLLPPNPDKAGMMEEFRQSASKILCPLCHTGAPCRHFKSQISLVIALTPKKRKVTPSPVSQKTGWKTTRVLELIAAKIKCENCGHTAPCIHLSNLDFQVNLETGEFRRAPKPKSAKKILQKALRREKNRKNHGKQKRHKTTLEEYRQQQIDNPTKAGNYFAALVSNQFPHRQCLREVIRGYYIMDFYFPAVNLCVEIDGGIHELEKVKEHDCNRDQYLSRVHGLRILRITNKQVLKEPETVVKILSEYLTDKQRKRSDLGNPGPYQGTCAPADPAEFSQALSTAVLSR
jgi:very-short-patch-repair endonuclease